MHQELDLGTVADHGDEIGFADLGGEFAEHAAGAAAVDEAGADDERIVGQGDFFNFELGLAVERTAGIVGADGGDLNDVADAGRLGGFEQFCGAIHVHGLELCPFEGLEIVGAMHQRGDAGERGGVDFAAELKGDAAGAGLG